LSAGGAIVVVYPFACDFENDGTVGQGLDVEIADPRKRDSHRLQRQQEQQFYYE